MVNETDLKQYITKKYVETNLVENEFKEMSINLLKIENAIKNNEDYHKIV